MGDNTDSDSTKAGSGKSGGSLTSVNSTPEQAASRHVPNFQPIDAEDARSRAAAEQWRTFTMLLEPQVSC